jgi:hypothetical protein
MNAFTKAQPEAPAPTDPWKNYGTGNITMEALLKQSGASTPQVEVAEVFLQSEYRILSEALAEFSDQTKVATRLLSNDHALENYLDEQVSLLSLHLKHYCPYQMVTSDRAPVTRSYAYCMLSTNRSLTS